MRRSVVCAVLICQWLVACGGDNGPPAYVPPRMDGGDEDGSAGSASTDGGAGSAATDGGAGDGGVMLTGDLCTDHLSGISCEVEQIGGGAGFFCARFRGGDAKCWGRSRAGSGSHAGDEPDEMGDNLPFVELEAPAIDVTQRWSEPVFKYEGNRYSGRLGQLDFGRPPTRLLPGVELAAPWALFGDAMAIQVTGLTSLRPTTLPFIPVDIWAASQDPLGGYGIRNNICALSDQGDVHCWGWLGYDDPDAAVALPFGEAISDISVDAMIACAITVGGDLKCWGAESVALAQGDPATVGSIGVAEIAALPRIDVGSQRVTQVSIGGGTSPVVCAILEGGYLKCWGRNTQGALGRGNLDAYFGAIPRELRNAPPIDLGTGRRALQIVAGPSMCALLDDHSVKCWGRNEFGEHGQGDRVSRGGQVSEMGDNLPRVDFGTMSSGMLAALAPQVSVTLPLPSVAPATDLIHTGDTLNVTCSVLAASETTDGVDESSVMIRLRAGAAGGEILSETSASRTQGETFEGTLLGLGAVATGTYWVECIANDMADPPRTGRGGVSILHDSGPTIVVTSPLPDAVVGQRAAMQVEVQVTAARLANVDAQADVDTFHLVVAGEEITLTASTTDPGLYSARVDFNSGQFQPVPEGPVLISVEATNLRGTTAVVQQTVIVDGQGPVITVTRPIEGQLVRGAQTIVLNVVDNPAGVDPTGVTGRIATTQFPFALTTDSTFQGVFDSLQFDQSSTQITVTLRAVDTVGNVTVRTVTLAQDNRPPVISLDPPPIREFKRSGVNTLCSEAFDPVGSDSVNEGDVVPEGAEFRARVEDRTNGLDGEGVLVYFADVAPNSVRVYLMADRTRPILIDTDFNGTCDEINDEADAAFLLEQRDMEAALPRGASFYPASAQDLSLPAWDDDLCTAGAVVMPPMLVCSVTSPLRRIIKAPLLGAARPAIWGLRDVDMNSCVGRSWDWKIQFPEGGPVCAVARAEDNLGNVGVSVPLRLCLQRTTGTGPMFDCEGADQSWRTHDCLTGTYGGDPGVTCTPPQDFPTSGNGSYVREDNP